MKEMYGIDFKEELKIYKSACKGQRENITYSNWKEHILEQLKDLKASELEDLKHLCLYRKRGERYGVTVFMALITLLIPGYIAYVLNDTNPMAILAYGIIAAIVASFITIDYFKYTVSENFYLDLYKMVKSRIKKLKKEVMNGNIEVCND